jgi:isopenicillin-N epimerase
MARNRETALAARRTLCRALGVPTPAPDAMLGSLASVPLPDGGLRDLTVGKPLDPLQTALYREFKIEVPVLAWPVLPRRLLRVSAQLYNGPAQYERLAAALADLLGA